VTSGGTRWLRAGSLALVAALALGVRASVPADAQRQLFQVVVSGLGYGHLLGALLLGRRRHGLRDRMLLAVTLWTAGVAAGPWLVTSVGPALLIPFAALAVWHVLENDRALGRADTGSLRLPPLPRGAGTQLRMALGALALVLLLLLVSRYAPWLVRAGAPLWLVRWSPDEVVGALLLHHTLVWLGRGLFEAGSARLRGGRAAVLAVHALPLLALAAIGAADPAAFFFVASPALYLFLSAAHAIHTSVERGLEPG
jgi:hypothetical protein